MENGCYYLCNHWSGRKYDFSTFCYAYLPTMVLNGVGDIASMAKAKEE